MQNFIKRKTFKLKIIKLERKLIARFIKLSHVSCCLGSWGMSLNRDWLWVKSIRRDLHQIHHRHAMLGSRRFPHGNKLYCYWFCTLLGQLLTLELSYGSFADGEHYRQFHFEFDVNSQVSALHRIYFLYFELLDFLWHSRFSMLYYVSLSLG